jgi:hypothetical protein
MKRPGRPKLQDPDRSVDLHFRLPAKQYDAAYQQARRDRLTVPEWIRRTLDNSLRQKIGR